MENLQCEENTQGIIDDPVIDLGMNMALEPVMPDQVFAGSLKTDADSKFLAQNYIQNLQEISKKVMPTYIMPPNIDINSCESNKSLRQQS